MPTADARLRTSINVLKELEFVLPGMEDFLLDNDHPDVIAELQRRQKDTEAAAGEGGGEDDDEGVTVPDTTTKWQSAHMQAAEKLGVVWPFQTVPSFEDDAWFQTLTAREQELVSFVYLCNEKKEKAADRVLFFDVSQTISRIPSSTTVVPTLLPHSKLWSVQKERLLIASEYLSLQGFNFPPVKLQEFSASQLTDLAGNAFSVPVFMAALASTLAMHQCSGDEPTPEDPNVQQTSDQDLHLLMFSGFLVALYFLICFLGVHLVGSTWFEPLSALFWLLTSCSAGSR